MSLIADLKSLEPSQRNAKPDLTLRQQQAQTQQQTLRAPPIAEHIHPPGDMQLPPPGAPPAERPPAALSGAARGLPTGWIATAP